MPTTAQGQSSALDTRLSPEPVTHLPQSRLLPLLLDSVGGAPVTFDRRVDEVHNVGTGPITAVGSTSEGSKWQLSCDFLVAADGANSCIRCARLTSREGKMCAHDPASEVSASWARSVLSREWVCS